MSDAEILELIVFITYRFYGSAPDKGMLHNAIADWIADWRVLQARARVEAATHQQPNKEETQA